MTTTATEKCFANIVIMENICKYLNYKDEYVLLNTTKELQHIIINYIWKTKYKEVEIFGFGNDNCVVSNKIGTVVNKGFVSPKSEPPYIMETNNTIDINKMQMFTYYDREKISKFELSRIIQTNNEIFDISEMQMFVNYNKENISKLQIQYHLSDNIPIDTFKSMKNLKVLHLIGIKCSYTHLKDLLNNLNLEEFTLEYFESGSELTKKRIHLDSDINVEKLKAFKVFKIYKIENRDDYLHFQHYCLPNFENLCHLELEARITVDFFDIILQFCKKLTHLKLVGCEFNIFKPLPMLQELELHKCEGLSWNNLKMILSEMNLKCFRSFGTLYKFDNDTPDYFYINPTLQEIHFNPEYKYIYNLLSYNDGKLNDLREMHLVGQTLNYRIELPNIISNLKVLRIHIFEGINCPIYMELKNLQTLVIHLVFFIRNEFSNLLMLQNLQELSISHSWKIPMPFDSNPLSAFQTNLHYFYTCWPEVEHRLVFICDLLRINRKLTLICRQIDYNNIIDIVSRTTFLTHCNTINVCGFHLDRLSILNNCIGTLNQLKSIIDTFDELNLETYFILQ